MNPGHLISSRNTLGEPGDNEAVRVLPPETDPHAPRPDAGRTAPGGSHPLWWVVGDGESTPTLLVGRLLES